MTDAAAFGNRAQLARLPASFAGLPFTVLRATIDGSNATVEDVLIGRGTSTRFVVAGRERIALEGHIGLYDPDIPFDGQLRTDERVREFRRRLNLFHTDDRTGLLIHPWFGPMDVVPDSWSFSTDATQIEQWTFRSVFLSTELPPIPTGVGVIADSATECIDEITQASLTFVNETAATAQLLPLQASLGIPDSVTGEDYAAAATNKLLTDGNIVTDADIPKQIQSLGAATRAGEIGELTIGGRDALIDDLLLTATRHDSPTILNMMEAWQLYLGTLGVGAFGEIQARPLKRLQTVPGDFDTLARKNRDAIFNWSIGALVRL